MKSSGAYRSLCQRKARETISESKRKAQSKSQPKQASKRAPRLGALFLSASRAVDMNCDPESESGEHERPEHDEAIKSG